MRHRILFLIIFLIAFFSFSIAQLPLALVLKLANVEQSDLRWSSAHGTVWDGRLQDVYAAQYAIGNIKLKASPLSILTLRYVGLLTIQGQYLQVASKIVIGVDGSVVLADGSARIILEGYDIRDAFNAPMRGDVDIKIDDLVVTRRGCREASFSMETNALMNMAKNYGGIGFSLTGRARCEQSSLMLPLTGQNGSESVSINTRIKPNLDYVSEVVVETADRRLQLGLRGYGFQNRDNQLIFTQSGNFITAP